MNYKPKNEEKKMEQFSWLDCVTGEQILDDIEKEVYVLVPKEFGGGHISEHCYDGFGHFDGEDIYELVADWNRSSLEPDHIFPSAINRYGFYMEIKKIDPEYTENIEFKAKEKPWFWPYKDQSLDKAGFKFVTDHEYSDIGIELTTYDEDNASLKYPIKITYDKDAVYEDCGPSLIDPDQGWSKEKVSEYENYLSMDAVL